MSNSLGERAWILMAKSDEERSWAANTGYDDSVGTYHSYDSNVANSTNVKVGDVLVIRENEYIAGWGIAEQIDVLPDATKEITRCPSCRKTNFYPRKNTVPKNRCNSCKHEFSDSDALVTYQTVTAYRCFYANTWVEAARPIHRNDLASRYATKDTHNAIRPLILASLPELLNRISGRDVSLPMDFSDTLVSQITGGHTTSVVRRRRGQRAFRFMMMNRFGEMCAFTGAQPPQVLEAAHLYSYAKKPEHHSDGGLLLRRDFHALFDANLITVNPDTWQIEIAPRLQSDDAYRSLDQTPLLVSEAKRPDRELLLEHYLQSERVFHHN
jgi:HNH endonuclease